MCVCANLLIQAINDGYLFPIALKYLARLSRGSIALGKVTDSVGELRKLLKVFVIVVPLLLNNGGIRRLSNRN